MKDPVAQFSALERVAELQEEDIEERKAICGHIVETFARNNFECRLFPFGSSLNGLGFRGCDLDAYLSFSKGSFNISIMSSHSKCPFLPSSRCCSAF